MPSHQAGDLLLAFAFRDGSTTAPTLASGWTSIRASGANTCSARVAFKIAASGSETSGTWTNATSLIIVVYRGVQGTDPIGASGITGGSATSISYPALALEVTDGSSWVFGAAGHRSVNVAIETAPSGLTNVTSVSDATDEAAAHDSNGGITSWSATSASVGGTASGYRSVTVELRAQPIETATLSVQESGDSTNVPATKWDPAQAYADLTLSSGNAVATTTTAFAQGNLRSVTSYNGSEKVYFECDVVYGVGGSAFVGVANASQALDAAPVSANAITYCGDDGNIWTNNVGTTYGSTWTTQRIGVALDVAGPTMYVRRAGVWQGGGDPVAGTGGVAVGFAGPYFATAGFIFPEPTFEVTLYTDAAEFADPAPTGYDPWSSALKIDITVIPSLGAIAAMLTTTEGADAAAFAAQRGHPATLASVEAGDIAAFGVQRGHPMTLGGTEGSDTAAMTAKRGHPATLTATEGSDVAAMSATRVTTKNVTLLVIEGGDTAVISASASGASASGSDYLQRRRRRRA